MCVYIVYIHICEQIHTILDINYMQYERSVYMNYYRCEMYQIISSVFLYLN